MKTALIVALGSGLALAALTPTSSQAVFKPGFGGFGLHPFLGRGFAHRRASRLPQYPWYGGVAAYDPYLSFAPSGGGDDNTIIKLMPPPEPPRALTCQHSEETKAVPSEDGGVKQIVIKRC